MTQQERDWLDWLKRTRDGVVTQKQAAAKMGVTDRWVRELLSDLEQEGDRVVIHGLRGQPSNHQIAKEIKQKALKSAGARLAGSGKSVGQRAIG